MTAALRVARAVGMAAVSWWALAACESSVTDPPPSLGDSVVVRLLPSATTISVGTTTTLEVEVANAADPRVRWSSAAPEVAHVGATGAVTGISEGRAVVSAISLQDSTRRAEAEVTVLGGGVFGRLRVAPAQADLLVGHTLALGATLEGVPAAVSWRTTDAEVASVSARGVVKAVGGGEAAIVAELAGDPTRRAVAVVRVGAGSPLTLPVLGLGSVAERFTGEVAVRGDWAYTSTWGNRGVPGNAIKIWNVRGSVPVLFDSLIVAGATTTGDLQISDDGGLLVVAVEPNPNGAIVIYDRSDPALPRLLTRYATDHTAPGVHTVKLGRVAGRLYAFLSIDPGAQNPSRLVIVDLSDPRRPTEVWSEVMGKPFVHDVFVRDGLLFTALWNDGVRIWDIGGGDEGGSPSRPVLLGHDPSVSGSIHNLWWFHDPSDGSRRYLFVGEEVSGSMLSGTAGDLHVFDVSDLSSPFQVAQFGVPGAGAHNFWMDEASGILYAAFYNGGVRALDVRGDLGGCRDSYRNSNGFCDLRRMGREVGLGVPALAYFWGVVHQGTHLYASDMSAGLYKLDASALSR